MEPDPLPLRKLSKLIIDCIKKQQKPPIKRALRKAVRNNTV